MRAVIIPAYEPDDILIDIVESICYKPDFTVIVVDDGSGNKYEDIFSKIEDISIVIKHSENKGKGEGIKTGLKFINDNLAEVENIVIMDADGQHKVEDMERVIAMSENNKGALVIGSRTFSGKIPIKSKLGNKITKVVFEMASRVKVNDTQTGLRAFSRDLIPTFLDVLGSRYEYEMNMLFVCSKYKIPIVEVPIKTIYHDQDNSCSHFRKVKDSIRIYKEIIKFSMSSITSFFIDYILFVLLISILPNGYKFILISNVIARLVSGGANFYINEKVVFKKKSFNIKRLIEYIGLACMILFLNNIILIAYITYLSMPSEVAKIFTEVTLFIISFTVQNKFIFKKDKKEIGKEAV